MIYTHPPGDSKYRDNIDEILPPALPPVVGTYELKIRLSNFYSTGSFLGHWFENQPLSYDKKNLCLAQPSPISA